MKLREVGVSPYCGALKRGYSVTMITLPDTGIRVLAAIETLDYFDSQSATLAQHISPLDAWNIGLQDPQPMLKLAFRLRDAVSKLFGVRTIGGFSGIRKDSVQTGEHLDFFLVEYSDDNSLVLTERDRHLDVMTCLSTIGNEVCITSSVIVHNLFGRVYMLPVGIAHRFIVRNTLRRLQKKTAAMAHK